MVATTVDGIDLFTIADRPISGWVPSLKTGTASHISQPFCSQLEKHVLLWLEYYPHVVSYTRSDIGTLFAKTYRPPTPKDAPFAIGYTFEGKPYDNLPGAVSMFPNGTFFITEASMEDNKRQDRNLAKAETSHRLARLQEGAFWIGMERALIRQQCYNLVFLHARGRHFSLFLKPSKLCRKSDVGRSRQCRGNRMSSLLDINDLHIWWKRNILHLGTFRALARETGK